MTIAEMRALLGLGPEVSDAEVVDAYAASISEASATPTASEPPLTLEAAKRQLGLVDFDDDDILIDELLAGAVDQIERATGIVMSRRPVIETANGLRQLKLRSWPIASIDAVTYIDGAGEDQVLSPTLYRVTASRPVRIVPVAPWPSALCEPGSVTIAATAGYDGPEDVPPTLLTAIKTLLAEYYLNREVSALSDAAQRSLKWQLRDFTLKTL